MISKIYYLLVIFNINICNEDDWRGLIKVSLYTKRGMREKVIANCIELNSSVLIKIR